MENSQILKDFKANAEFRLNESRRFVIKSLEMISEKDVWEKPNDSLNTIGNLILHLCGNMRQYGVDSILNSDDNRQRDLEFEITEGLTKKELLGVFEKTIDDVVKAMNTCDDKEFMRIRSVQGFEFSGLGNVLHVVEHLSYHTGQIAYATKILKNKDLGFYEGLDLNQKKRIIC